MKGRKLASIAFGLVFVLVLAACASNVVIAGPLTPNDSQSVILIRRANGSIEKGEEMFVLIDGRSEGVKIDNGAQASYLVRNGMHNIQVRVDKYTSQMLTFDCESEVVEFFASFEGEEKSFLFFGSDTAQLSLMKTAGGEGRRAAPAANAPVINVQVDNSSSNTASSSGNTVSGDNNSSSTNTTTTTTTDNSVR